jgi:MinD superfamily P-loop ATPase
MIISVASGKGGTGKTTVAVNLALSLNNVQFLDCDVEEPNAHIFLKPNIIEQKKAYIPVPEIDQLKCNYCGKCAVVCAYHAIAVIKGQDRSSSKVLIFPHLCHGCGACQYFCPERAIREVNRTIGIIEIGKCGKLDFVHGKLNVSEPMSPPLIRQVKAHTNPAQTVIIDAPPGTSCPVIASVQASDFCILVTEPTPFGLNDFVLAVGALQKLKIPFGVIINRSDIGNNQVAQYCQENSIPLLMQIPFDKQIAVLYAQGIPLVQKKKEYLNKFEHLYQQINSLVNNCKQ